MKFLFHSNSFSSELPFFTNSCAAQGYRNFSCGTNGRVDSNSLSVAPVLPGPGSPYQFTGNAYYNQVKSQVEFGLYCLYDLQYNLFFLQDGLPEISLISPDGSPAGKIIVDSLRTTFEGRGDVLKWRRWSLLLINGPKVPWVQYIVMNETTGGAAPDPSACAGGKQWVQSPYTARYTYWTC